MRRASIIALGFLLAAGCSFHRKRLSSRTCAPLRVDRERAPQCATPESRASDRVLDLDAEPALASDTISIDGWEYGVMIGQPGMWAMPGSATMDMVLFGPKGGRPLHTAWGKLPGDSELLGTSTHRINNTDRLWVVRTRYVRHRPYTRTRVLYAVIDGALAAVRTESSLGRATEDSVWPVADTCTPVQQVQRLRHGTRLERLAMLAALEQAGRWDEVTPEVRAAVGELATSCDPWIHEQATLLIARGLYGGAWDAANPRVSPDSKTARQADSARVRELDEKIDGLQRVVLGLKGHPALLDYMLKLAKAHAEKADYFNSLTESLAEGITEAREAQDEETAARYENDRDDYRKIAALARDRSCRVLEGVVHDPRNARFEHMDEALYQLGTEQAALGEEVKARAAFQRLINDHPNSPRAPSAAQYLADYCRDDGLHDPPSPARSSGREAACEPEPEPEPEPVDQRAVKLTSTEIKAGIDTIRAGANRCFKGATAPEIVPIRVVVEGATGHVVEAEALDDAKDTALGACLAEQFLRIEYPLFRAERMAFTFMYRRPN